MENPQQPTEAGDSDNTRVVTVRIPGWLFDWVNEEFHHGFKQAYVLQCFLSLRYVMKEGELPPFSEYARLASIDAMTSIANSTRSQ